MSAPKPNGERAVLAWHFLHPRDKLRDGRDAPPDGEWLKQDGPIEPCVSGLHASESVIDALRYHPGQSRGVLCRVELRGTIVADGDKLAASERRILWRLDGDTTDDILRRFARWCALQVIDLWEAPDVVRQWLETGDESLRDAAGAAAWAAAGAAAWDAARAAARDVAWDAAWDAAWVAARGAAWYAAAPVAGAAARAAARDVAWGAARDAQNTHLEHLINEAHERQAAA